MTANAKTSSTAEKPTGDYIEAGFKPAELVLDAANQGQATSGYENLTLWETVKTFKFACAVCFAAAVSAGCDGYQIGINSSILANKGFIKQFATGIDASGKRYLVASILSAWGSIMSVGQVIGTVTIPFISNHYGRKISFYWLWFVLVTSVLAESLARTWPVWLVGKLLAGVGVGCLQAAVPPYISECAPTRIRGGLLMMYTFWWTVGSFFAQIALQNLNSTNPYKYLTAIYSQWAQIGVIFIICIVIPESPAWCATKGREQQAKKCLKNLNRDVPNYDVDRQYNLLIMLIEHERAVAAEQRREKWYAIFWGTDGRRTVTALWAALTQQFVGLKLFLTYGTYFFQQAGIKEPFTAKCITSGIKIVTVVVAVLIADKVGRRLMACSASTLSWISCIVIGILGVIPQSNATTYVFVLFAALWNVGITATGAAAAGFLGEISSQRLRPYTAGFAQASTCVVGIIMDVLVPYMVNAQKWNWGFKTGWFYAGLGAPAVVGMWLLIPETAGRSSAELDELFEKKTKAWRFAKTETATERLLRSQEPQ